MEDGSKLYLWGSLTYFLFECYLGSDPLWALFLSFYSWGGLFCQVVLLLLLPTEVL